MDVVELFSGIGAQAKALENIGIDYNILATCDWDINAIIAYDIIHNGPQETNRFEELDDDEIDEIINNLNLSVTGKKSMSDNAKKRMSRTLKNKLLYAIDRSNNLIDVQTIEGVNLPELITLMTYSFPCQDLSLAGNWHNNAGGIDRNSGNRSSLLWQVERILYERRDHDMSFPRFLLMENVSAILSTKHIHNFTEWQNNLVALGYKNIVLTLDARDFGVPQMRKRTYMISIYMGDLNQQQVEDVNQLCDDVNENNLSQNYPREVFTMENVLKLNYNNEQYLHEANSANPNRTVSREEIERNNIFITTATEYVPTITTKQDRHPNSGLITFENVNDSKMDFRYLTPRECFILMGFSENDYQSLMDNDFMINKSKNFFSRDKLYKMAGNSICVNVLESIFEFLVDIENVIE